ncbi:SMP-30/gluconolactonase/LRE family protein [Neptunicella marina]|uniref:SMP-30/gluconolactonase/LRE family protein n=1 Tax=Neptunicella marina TaxID=2125989 RepID=A0A8J6M3Y4_9ALTE|nr:SMP-30/gluconolactonase/LRE family protein [Neptunicella marina]MBC3765711.1 SMP-30/gluconolactonase/LRE family protein [Neptunicella marina]
MNKTTLFLAGLILSTQGVNAAIPEQQAKLFGEAGQFTKGIEGPAVDASGQLFAVNYQQQGTIGQIDINGNASLYLTLPEGSTGNGIRFDKSGFMYVADYSGHNVLKIDPKDKSIRVHAHNEAMNQPNDIAITDNGVIYASDPNWKENSGQLWMVAPDGKTTLLEKSMGTTNGVEVSPDNKRLYVNESVQRNVWVYDIQPDNTLANKRLFYKFDDHGMDGMRTDEIGNLYIARYGAGLVVVLSPKGELIEQIKLTGQHPTNVAFGGKDGKQVFVTLQQTQVVNTFRSQFAGRSYNLLHSNE